MIVLGLGLWTRDCRRTLSCPPRRIGKTCGPMYRRYMHGHVCLLNMSTSFWDERSLKDVRLGAVSSGKTDYL